MLGPSNELILRFFVLIVIFSITCHINILLVLQVQAQLKASSLELTGLPHDIFLVEEKLNKLLCDIEILNFQFPLQVGTILGFNSPKQLVSELMSIANVSFRIFL